MKSSNKRNLTAEDFPIIGVGENGRNLCRVCHTEVPKNRRTICSDACQKEINIQTSSSYARHYVEVRDRGVCALCGLDTEKLKRVAEKLALRDYHTKHGTQNSRYYNTVGITVKALKDIAVVGLQKMIEKYPIIKRYPEHLWEADHIIPVCQGGTLTLTNLRTLCINCHKEETKTLMASMRGDNDKKRRS